MSTLNCCPPDYSLFSLEDFELTYDLLRSVIHSAANVVCLTPAAPGPMRPAALFAEAHIVNPALDNLAAMVAFLRGVRFATSRQNERALVLVAKYELDFGNASVDAVADLVRTRQRPRLAA